MNVWPRWAKILGFNFQFAEGPCFCLPFSGPVSGRQLLAEVSDEIRFAAFQLKII